MDRDVLHQIGKPPLVYKGLHEPAICQIGRDPLWNSSSQVNATGGQDLKRQIAGFSAENRPKDLPGGRTQRVSGRIFQRGIHNQWGAVRR